jgi:hypothetical protein
LKALLDDQHEVRTAGSISGRVRQPDTDGKEILVKKIAVLTLLLLSLGSYAAATCFVDFITESLPSFTVGVPANFQIDVCCGTPPYTFTIYSGSFPPGMSMSSSGKITGTPTTVGFYTVCITLTDSVGCHTTRCYEIYVE